MRQKRLSWSRTLSGAIASVMTLAAVVVPGTVAIAGHDQQHVGCDVGALKVAITHANENADRDVIELDGNCTYELSGADNGSGDDATGLPVVTSPVFIDGNGATIRRNGASGAFRIFKVDVGGALALAHVEMAGGDASLGGGIHNAGGQLSITHSTMAGNLGNGGAIFNTGNMEVSRSLLHGNGDAGGNGGAIWTSGSAKIVNSTLASNAGSSAGAIFASGAAVGVLNSTIAGNTSTVLPAGIFASNGATVTVRNTVLANHGTSSCREGVDSSIVDEGGNLVWPATDTSCPDTIGHGDPRLGALQDNGGLTWTMALGEGSAAIDAALVASCPSTDQRDVARPQGAGCDVGAYEADAPASPPPAAPTDLLYDGDQLVYAGQDLAPSAVLSSADPACVGPDHEVTFWLDDDPTTETLDDGPSLLAAAPTNAAGHALASPVDTGDWVTGVYGLRAEYTGTDLCLDAFDEATLTIADPGASANGGGWYSLAGSGRVNAAFTVRVIEGSDPVAHRGQLLLINNGKWRLKGTIDRYGQVEHSGSASGVGNLYRWDLAAEDWVLSEADVPFTATFEDAATGGKGRKHGEATDTFGIHIDHVTTSDDPALLPNSEPRPLGGGNVVVGEAALPEPNTGRHGGGRKH